MRRCVACASAGYDEASLDVDADDPAGALGVYRRAGFEVETRWSKYTAERGPRRAPAPPTT